MSEQPKCEICGEPMPSGEEMFKFHGYSGNCPKPPLPMAAHVATGELAHSQPSVEALRRLVHEWRTKEAGETCDANVGYNRARKDCADDLAGLLRDA